MSQKPLINKTYKLQRFQAKGGWTYVAIPEILQDKRSAPGWVRVKGSIDNYEFKNYHLMPLGNGTLFLPVKAEIRKKIGKAEGDHVKLILFKDSSPLEIPQELLICLEDEPKAFVMFKKLPEVYQKEFINWIHAAKKEETKIARMAATVNKVLSGQTLNRK